MWRAAWNTVKHLEVDQQCGTLCCVYKDWDSILGMADGLYIVATANEWESSRNKNEKLWGLDIRKYRCTLLSFIAAMPELTSWVVWNSCVNFALPQGTIIGQCDKDRKSRGLWVCKGQRKTMRNKMQMMGYRDIKLENWVVLSLSIVW